MTFESAYRHLDRLGDRFGMIVVDEVHHFGGGVRAEALEMAVAPRRLGLTATGPDPDSPAADNLATLVGPVVFEIDLACLAGTHLAPFEHVLMHVELDRDERRRYERAIRPFNAHCREFLGRHPEASYRDLVAALSASAPGEPRSRGITSVQTLDQRRSQARRPEHAPA